MPKQKFIISLRIIIKHIFTIYKLRKNEYEREEEASMCLQEIEGQRYHESERDTRGRWRKR
jgi:hypothetical protein